MSPFRKEELLIAWRYLQPQAKQGFISLIAMFSLLGIMLGVATLIIVLSVMNGFRAEMLSRILGFNSHVTISAPAIRSDALTQIKPVIAAQPGVVSASEVIDGQAMIMAGGAARGVLVKGMTVEALKERGLIASHVTAGALSALDEPGAVMIGARLAERLGLSLGDTVNLVSASSTVTAFGSLPRLYAGRVAAIFDVGMFEYDFGVIFVSLKAAQYLFDLPQAVTGVEVFLQDPDRTDEVVRALRLGVRSDVRIYDWRALNASFFGALEVERNVMFIILTLIILVAAFNIISSLIMMVTEKRRSIAVLRTIGVTRRSITKIFFLCGSSVGVVGTILGVLLGVLFVRNIDAIKEVVQAITGAKLFAPEVYFLSRLPAKMDPVEVVVIAGMALALTFVATIYPAWRAAQVDPAEALRYE